MEKRKCVICGKEFETNHKKKLTCSDECSRKRQAEMNREAGRKRCANKKSTLKPKKCVICGKEFMPKRETQNTCGAECRKIKQAEDAASWRLRHRKQEKKEVTTKSTLAEKTAEAARLGMTYGQWQALQTLKEVERCL